MTQLLSELAFARGPSMKNRFMVAPLTNTQSREDGVLTDEEFRWLTMRAQQAGFDGVELHGAHGYILCQFFSDEINFRNDEYGGSVDNRWRILDEIIGGVRSRCRGDFMLGVRLSPERFGMRLAEVKSMALRLMERGQLDFLDMSLWDVFKEPEEDEHNGRSLLSHFTELPRGNTRLGVAGKIRTPAEAEWTINEGVDWVMLGRAAILHHDFPNRYESDPGFAPVETPVTRSYLESEGLSENFVNYMSSWTGFVEG